MAKLSIWHYLVDLRLIEPEHPIELRIPSPTPPADVMGVWHVPDDCEPGMRTRKVTMTAAEVLDAVTGPEARAVLCECLRLTDPDLPDDHPGLRNIQALHWLVDLHDMTTRNSLFAVGRTRLLARTPPDNDAAVIDRAIVDALAAAGEHVARCPDDLGYQFKQALNLVRGYRDLAKWMRFGAVSEDAVRIWRGRGQLIEDILEDPRVRDHYEMWKATAWDDHTAESVQAAVMAMTSPKLWALLPLHGDPEVLGGADIVEPHDDGWLLRAPLLTLATSQWCQLVALDCGYTADVIRDALHLPRDPDQGDGVWVEDDILDAVRTARH